MRGLDRERTGESWEKLWVYSGWVVLTCRDRRTATASVGRKDSKSPTRRDTDVHTERTTKRRKQTKPDEIKTEAASSSAGRKRDSFLVSCGLG